MAETGTLRVGEMVLDLARGLLLDGAGAEVPLRRKSFDLLRVLAVHAGRTLSKDELLDAVWRDVHVTEDSLTQCVRDIRRAIGDPEGKVLRTIPRRGYLLDAEVHAEAGPTAAARRPSVVVLPFQYIGADPSEDYVADAVVEEITSALARIRWLFVVSRNTAFTFKEQPVDVREVGQKVGVRYALEGSVRRAGQRVRVACRLVETETGHHVWAGVHDGVAEDVFAFQDDVTRSVAAAIEPAMLESEALRAIARRRGGDATALDLVRQGIWHFHKVAPEGHLAARALFREAARSDPELTEAWIWLARVCAGRIAYGWSDDFATDRKEANDAALRAIELDERDPYAHYAFAISSAYGGEAEDAVRAGERVVEMLPFFALGHLVLGMACLFSGRAERAAASLERGLRLNPADPQNFVWLQLLSTARLFSGRGEAALEAALHAVQIRPSWRPSYECAACCCAALGRRDEARTWATKMARLSPPAGDVLAPMRARCPAWQAKLVEWLRQAGRSE